jgi:glycine/D-amino acid oxidase-like deaminating enzyme
VFYLATTEAALARHAAFVPLAAAHGIDSTMLSAAEVAAMMPAAARRWLGGLWTPSDLRAEPWVAVPALARLAAARGVRVVEHCAVRALDVAAGRVTGMVTEQGRIAAPAVVLPGGAWSGLMLGRHGVGLPQLLVRATVARTETLPEVFGGAASDGRIAFRRRADGGYTLAAGGAAELFLGPPAFKNAARYRPVLRRNPFAIRPLGPPPAGHPDAWTTPRTWAEDGPSPFEAMRVLDPAPSRRRLAAIRAEFGATFPQIGPPVLSHAWAGMIDTLPDVVPVIDTCAALPGLIVATGMSGHGFGIGPGVGRIVAELVQGHAPRHDLARFRLGRFTDGSTLRPGPGLCGGAAPSCARGAHDAHDMVPTIDARAFWAGGVEEPDIIGAVRSLGGKHAMPVADLCIGPLEDARAEVAREGRHLLARHGAVDGEKVLGRIGREIARQH